MNVPIDAKRLRATLPDVVERVRKGTRTVIYRSRPAFQIVPVDDQASAPISLAELTTVITTDGHFRRLGFDVLPATRPRRTRKPRRS